MDRYVFKDSRATRVYVIIILSVVAFVIYASRRSIVDGILVGLFVLLFSCTTLRALLFTDKELIIINIYGMTFYVRYNEIKCFDKGIGNYALIIIALKKKFIPLCFFSHGELAEQLGEILARLAANTGRKRGVIFESKKSAQSAATTHDDTPELEVMFAGKNDTHVMTRPMLYLAKAVRVLSIGFLVCVVVIFGLGILIDMHKLPDALRNNLDQIRYLLWDRILYGIIILIAVAALYVKVIRHHIIKPKQ